MSVSITEILKGASVHAVPLAGECAGYLVLAAADQTVAAPRRIGPSEVHLEGDGRVRVEGARAAAEADSEGDLRALLDALLVNSSSATPALLRASRRAPGRGIAAFVREIETALIPVNRAAAHRALARLERETERARQKGQLDRAAAPTVTRSENVKASAEVVVPTPAPPEVVAIERPAVESVQLLDSADEIPSLFAPPVEAIAAYAAEIETRPEPIVARRSAPPPPPPSRTPSHAPPVAEVQRVTPVFGTVVGSIGSDDELEIEVVIEDEFANDELADDELTGVLVRSAPLEVSALLDAVALAELTEPCPPALDEASQPEATVLLAEVAEIPTLAVPSDPVAEELPPVSAVEHPVVVEAVEHPVVVEVVEPHASDAPLERSAAPAVAEVDDGLMAHLTEESSEEDEVEPVRTIVLPRVVAPPVVEAPVSPSSAGASAPVGDSLECEPTETHGETAALALAFEPVVESLPLQPKMPMPMPRPSDVEDLLARMTQASVNADDDVRTSLKSLAGLEPTPPPPKI